MYMYVSIAKVLGNSCYNACTCICITNTCTCIFEMFFYEQVATHLAKLFDSMARLKFGEDEDKEPSKEALGMWSKDGEYVDFNKPCMCVGQVESWLNYLLETMQATIRHVFTEAVVTYEEKPRDQWIFEPPAQVEYAFIHVLHLLFSSWLYTKLHVVIYGWQV